MGILKKDIQHITDNDLKEILSQFQRKFNDYFFHSMASCNTLGVSRLEYERTVMSQAMEEQKQVWRKTSRGAVNRAKLIEKIPEYARQEHNNESRVYTKKPYFETLQNEVSLEDSKELALFLNEVEVVE